MCTVGSIGTETERWRKRQREINKSSSDDFVSKRSNAVINLTTFEIESSQQKHRW